MLFDTGDVLPSLIVQSAYRLLPSDVVWGVQDKKGWILESEPYTVAEPAISGPKWHNVIVRTTDGGMRSYPDHDALVLVEK